LVFQFPGLFSALSAIDNVALPALLQRKGTAAAAYHRADDLLARVGLSAKKTAYAAELSGGEQRRAALARAIATAPPIILADEPTSDLDPDTAASIVDLLLEIHRRDGTALVVVTHDPEIARRADHIIEIREGSVAATRDGPRPADAPRLSLPSLAGAEDLLSAAESAPPRCAGIPDRANVGQPFQADVRPESLTYDTETSAVPLGASESRPSIRLGAGLAPWLLSIGAWLVPAVFVGLALNQGVALYQRHLLIQRRLAREALEDRALLWLRASIDDISYGPGTSYTLTLALVNLAPQKSVFAMSPTVRAYVQVGLAWQEIPIKPDDGQEGKVARIESKRLFQYVFQPSVKDFTEQLAGYMHVRFNYATLVSERSQPGDDLIERVDNDYVHLKPQGTDVRKTRFPGKPPIWIPMPPH
jgi:energy-coupling factor transporter ATP-binding protein EcfA2